VHDQQRGARGDDGRGLGGHGPFREDVRHDLSV